MVPHLPLLLPPPLPKPSTTYLTSPLHGISAFQQTDTNPSLSPYSAHAVTCGCSGHWNVALGWHFNDKRFTDLKHVVRELGDDVHIPFFLFFVHVNLFFLVRSCAYKNYLSHLANI